MVKNRNTCCSRSCCNRTSGGRKGRRDRFPRPYEHDRSTLSGTWSSRAREFHPHPLTEPCVKVSPHTALHTLCFVHMLLSSYPPLCLRVVYLHCSSLSAFPLAFRLLPPTFHQRACITVLPPLCRMPQCHRQVIALLVARTVRHRETFSHLIGSYGYILYGR